MMTGWSIYLLLFGLFILSALIYRLYIRIEYQRKGKLRFFASIIQAALFFIWGGFPTLYLPKNWPVSSINPVLLLLGRIGLIVGLLSLIGGMIQLGLGKSLGMEQKRLRDTGLYSISRNPQILGCAIYIFSFVLLWPSWYALVWGILLMGVLHIMVTTEEEHLRIVFGKSYQDYCQKVPRYLNRHLLFFRRN